MKAIVRVKYGMPEVLRLDDVPTPVPSANEVLVKVVAASVAKGDWEILRGRPMWVRLAGFGFFQPKVRILGYNFSGRVEAVGDKVKEFKIGDEVFGDILQHGLGAFAEYVIVSEHAAVAGRPNSITHEEAASLPEAGCIALQTLKQIGGIQPGSKVLVNGGGGGAGSFFIQLAKAKGALVTGVDRTEKLDLMQSLGAEQTVDYTQTEIYEINETYDVILDVVGVGPLRKWKRLLRNEGTYLAAGGSVSHIAKTLLFGFWSSKTSSKKFGMLAVVPSKNDMHAIVELVETGVVKAVIERTYAISDTPSAIQHLGQGLSQGKLVITM